jgi:hypothetical protein
MDSTSNRIRGVATLCTLDALFTGDSCSDRGTPISLWMLGPDGLALYPYRVVLGMDNAIAIPLVHTESPVLPSYAWCLPKVEPAETRNDFSTGPQRSSYELHQAVVVALGKDFGLAVVDIEFHSGIHLAGSSVAEHAVERIIDFLAGKVECLLVLHKLVARIVQAQETGTFVASAGKLFVKNPALGGSFNRMNLR